MREAAVGDRIDDYDLQELLARSGMASIFKAVDVTSGKTVAVKIPHPHLEGDVVFFERFRREEKMGQRLDHPSIVKVLEPREKSRAYLAMELVEGRSLRATMQEQRQLPVERALEIARAVTEALVYMHAHGVVHRDIKPENILLVGDHALKILDFGIALDESARRLTWAGLSTTIGTPDYMAPEQVGGRRGDARTDVYSVGMLLYEMLTGNVPFSAANPHALMRAKTTEDPKAPSYYLPNIDPALEVLILRALARAPRDRFETAAELLEALRDPAAAAARDPEAARARARRFGLRRWLFPSVVVGLLVGLGALVWLSGRHAPAPPPRSPRRRGVADMEAPATPSMNLAWVLVAAFLVMFMQVGFAMVETGFTRAKNAVNTMAMNLVVYPLGVLAFWLVGYGVMMGGVAHWPTLGGAFAGAHEVALTIGGKSFGLFGASRFALVSVPHDAPNLAMFLFAAVFMDTAATIPTGAMAERWRFSSFLIYAIFMSAFLYPLYANWVWGGGWLSTLGVTCGLGHGHVDFAGSSVVHLTGGVTAYVGAHVLGPRAGKFRRDGTIGAMPGHNLPMAIIGTLILAFGWFGFNAGSTLSASDPRIATIAVNTMLSSSAGAFASLLYVWHVSRKPDIGMVCNGLLGGLVAVTASCAFVSPAAAVLIGSVAGFLVAWSVTALERRRRIDDPVGAIAVHGVCGAWGALALGVFADGTYGEGWNGVAGPVRGLLFGDAGQLAAQAIGVATNLLVVSGAVFLFFRVVERFVGNRVTAEVEFSGLDSTEMGSEAYPPG